MLPAPPKPEHTANSPVGTRHRTLLLLRIDVHPADGMVGPKATPKFRPTPDLGGGCAAAPWTGGSSAATPQWWGVAIGPALDGSRVGRRPPPDPGDGRAAAPWTGGSHAATPGQLWVQEVADPFVFSFPYRDYPPRSSSPSSSDVVELPPISRSGVAAWGSGWEEDFWLFFFFLKTKRVKEGDDPVFLPTLTFFVFFFLFHADMSTSYWWAKRWWFLPPPNRSYSLLNSIHTCHVFFKSAIHFALYT
jgi:hypothetical protein